MRQKKMVKKLIKIVLFTFILLMPFVLAEEINEKSLTELSENPGVTPDQSGYWMKLMKERIRLWFEFNQEKKAEKELELARLRLLEAKIMADKGDLKAMEKAQKEHDKLVEKVKKIIEKIKNDEKTFKNSVEKLVGIERALEAQKNRIEVLKEILDEKNLTDEQKAKLNEIISKLENKTKELSEKSEEKKEKLRNRMRESGKSEEEIEKIIEEIEKEKNLTVVLKIVAENRIRNAENAINKLKERINEEKTKNVNVSFFEEQVKEAEAVLEKAKALYNEGKYREVIELIKPLGNYGRNMKRIMEKVRETRIENRLERIEEIKREAIEQKNRLNQERIMKKYGDIFNNASLEKNDENPVNKEEIAVTNRIALQKR